MKNIVFIILGMLLVFPTFSQNMTENSNNLISEQTYFDLNFALQNPFIVKKLDLSKNSLDSLPKSISHLLNLEILILSDNYLSTLPEWFSELTNLKYLYLDNNNFTEMPTILYRINLIELNISNNQLTNVSSELKRIVTLKN